MVRRALFGILAFVGALSCGRSESQFYGNMAFDSIATVGGIGEDNQLFQFGRPQVWLADSTTVAYSDERAPGRVVVADILNGDGWVIDEPGGRGPGQLGKFTPFVGTAQDTIKLLTPFGRLSARSLRDGVLLYDSVLAQQSSGQIWAGIAHNSRVTIHAELRLGGEIALRLTSPERQRTIPVGHVETDDQVQGKLGVSAAARGNLIAYALNGAIYTRDWDGTLIAKRVLPWSIFSLSIDGTERVWVQVFGHNPAGYNLVVLDRELDTCGTAVIPGFRDAYDKYVISEKRDEFDVPLVTLRRLRVPRTRRKNNY